ncbi:Sodium-driven chloride bicarbonate exchanger [Liparis tanakae]|uniref:Sodium-driven chloride bicarbonate exchanger n=1 Tax=Liparis tanakae TaxID=230148 RepID=A0A4Z2GBP5_9TELE|nr:Sodium-driven chloride bicarbonate exchanger [Liparis tanakae]
MTGACVSFVVWSIRIGSGSSRGVFGDGLFTVIRTRSSFLWFLSVSQIDLHFMKKIPPGAEASNVLVGELEFLERPVVAFVRLAPAVLLNGLAEVPITTRFLFILLGPLGKGPQYHEIGRSIATLMTDEVRPKHY